MIFIAGGTGFVGRHLLESLKGRDIPVRCLVRDEKKGEWVRSLGFEAVKGDITDADSIQDVLDGAETVVHLVGVLKEEGNSTFDAVHVEGTQNLINESIASGVRKFFYQSALGADSGSPYKYLKTKARAEEFVTSSNISYTIFRPSLIVGRGDGFTERTKQLISAGPVVPVPGKGLAKFQPLYIKDWTKCFSAALEKEDAENRVYELGGPEQLTYIEILDQIMKVLNVSKTIVHLPMGITKLTLPFMGIARSFASVLGREIPDVTEELLSLLDEDNICDMDSIQKNFGFTPMRLSDALKEFLGEGE
jgi:uncharacterized protein YbjT (DUF2867 family)